jgi:hypothetical protein
VEHVQQRGVPKVSAEPVILGPSFSKVAGSSCVDGIADERLRQDSRSLSSPPCPSAMVWLAQRWTVAARRNLSSFGSPSANSTVSRLMR